MKLFTAPSCGPCRMLKGLLKDNKGVEFVDATEPDGMEQVEAYGIRSVPTLVTDDHEVIAGVMEIKKQLGI